MADLTLLTTPLLSATSPTAGNDSRARHRIERIMKEIEFIKAFEEQHPEKFKAIAVLYHEKFENYQRAVRAMDAKVAEKASETKKRGARKGPGVWSIFSLS